MVRPLLFMPKCGLLVASCNQKCMVPACRISGIFALKEHTGKYLGKTGKVSYEVTGGPTITVNDGICISGDAPDYKVDSNLSIPVFDAGGGEDMILGEKKPHGCSGEAEQGRSL